MQSETGFPSSHQLKSYVAYKSRPPEIGGARCPVSGCWPSCTLLYPFYSLFCRTIWVSWHQKGKPFWILLEQEMMGWQGHQLDRMQIICTLLQTDNHASTSPLRFCRPDALPAAQPTASKH